MIKIDDEGVLTHEHSYLVAYVVEKRKGGMVINHFANQMFVTDKMNKIAYNNLKKSLERRYAAEGRVTIIAINELDD